MRTIPQLLRAAADVVEAMPAEVPAPDVHVRPWADDIKITWHLSITDGDQQRDQALAIRRALGGTWNKGSVGDSFWLARKSEDLDLTIHCDREQVCHRVVTGTETVTVPAVEAQPERTEVREVVEWQCDPIVSEQVAS